MRAGIVAARPRRRARRVAFAISVLMLLGATEAVAATPQYEMSVSAGSSTREAFAYTSAEAYGVSGNPELALSIVRGGVPVATEVGYGFAALNQAPQVGDSVVLQDPIGTTVASVAYDGLPSIDPSVCVGASGISGQRTGAAAVTAGAYTLAAGGPYGYESRGYLTAQISSLSGSSFAGTFATALSAGQTVWASETLQSAAPGGGLFTYYSSMSRPVGACPAPAPRPAPAPAPAPAKLAALSAKILRLTGATLMKLLHSGWSIPVEVSQPGTVVMDLYMEGGRLPASASKKHPAVLLARGRALAKAPGRLTLHLRATPAGKTRLKHVRRVHAVLLTTFHGATGSVNLGKRKLTLRR